MTIGDSRCDAVNLGGWDTMRRRRRKVHLRDDLSQVKPSNLHIDVRVWLCQTTRSEANSRDYRGLHFLL